MAAGALASPATASAQGGVDPTRFCVQDGVNTYLYYPYAVQSVRTLAFKLLNCSLRFADHIADEENREVYRECLMEGYRHSVRAKDPTPLLVAADYCTAAYLEYQIQVDPTP